MLLLQCIDNASQISRARSSIELFTLNIQMSKFPRLHQQFQTFIQRKQNSCLVLSFFSISRVTVRLICTCKRRNISASWYSSINMRGNIFGVSLHCYGPRRYWFFIRFPISSNNFPTFVVCCTPVHYIAHYTNL